MVVLQHRLSKILQFLKDHDPDDIMNVVHLGDYIVFRRHLCISFELLSMNLFEFQHVFIIPITHVPVHASEA